MRKGINRIIAELVDSSSSGKITLRKWIKPEQKDTWSATACNAMEWKYTSTLCPSTHAKKNKKRARVAVARAEKLFDDGWRFFRVCVVPSRPIPRKISLDEQEARARSFFDEEAKARARLNADLKEIGLSLVQVAQHCALRGGRLDPHAHYLLGIAPDADWTWSEADARRQLVERVSCHHQYPMQHTPQPAEVINSARGFLDRETLVAHVNYLHEYPIRAYDAECDGGGKLPLRDAVEHKLFFRAIAALTGSDFSFKGCVVLAGAMRKPSHIKIKKAGPIHVVQHCEQGDFSEALFPDGEAHTMQVIEPAEVVEVGEVVDPAQTDFLFGLFPEQIDFSDTLFPAGEPVTGRHLLAEMGVLVAADAPRDVKRGPVAEAAPVVQTDFEDTLFPPRKWLGERVAACCATPPATEAESRLPAWIEPRLLHTFTRASREVAGLVETVAIIQFARGWSRLEIEKHFPFLASIWVRERQALRLSAAGLDDDDVMDLLEELAA